MADTGSGIPAELLSRIYDPFFTTKGDRQGYRPGTVGGLRSRAGAIIGVIECASEPDRGTRFTLRLPLAAARERTAGSVH